MRGEERERVRTPVNHAAIDLRYPFPGNTDPLRKLIRRDILEKKWLLPTLNVIAPISNQDLGIVFCGFLSLDIDVDVM